MAKLDLTGSVIFSPFYHKPCRSYLVMPGDVEWEVEVRSVQIYMGIECYALNDIKMCEKDKKGCEEEHYEMVVLFLFSFTLST